jgi:CheY-like chemotaxis protein
MAARILIADDQPDSAELLAVLLSFHGHDVRRAYDGLETLGIARQWRPDLLLLDERMPGMNGSSVCRALAESPDGTPCKVVLFSSCDERDVPWREAGAVAFLQKPVNVRALPAMVERLLAGAVGGAVCAADGDRTCAA